MNTIINAAKAHVSSYSRGPSSRQSACSLKSPSQQASRTSISQAVSMKSLAVTRGPGRKQSSINDVSASIVSQCKPKEIEDLFVNSRNFYKNISQQPAASSKHLQDTQLIKDSDEVPINNVKHTEKHRPLMQGKTHIQSTASKRPANMIRITKKQCTDDEAYPATPHSNGNILKGRSRSCSSIGSSLSSTPSMSMSMQRFTQENDVYSMKGDNPFAKELQPTLPTTLSSHRQHLQKQSQPLATSQVASGKRTESMVQSENRNPIKPIDASSVKQSCNITHADNSQQNLAKPQVFSSLGSFRYQQKAQKQVLLGQSSLKQDLTPRKNQSVSVFNDKTNSQLYSTPAQTALSRVLKDQSQLSRAINSQLNRKSTVPILKIELSSARKPSLADNPRVAIPQAKKLLDESEGELINSREMSQNLDQILSTERKEALKQGSPDPQGLSFGGNSQNLYSFSAGLESQKAFNGPVAGHQKNNYENMATALDRQSDSQDTREVRKSVRVGGSNSSKKRAKWMFSGNQSAYNNSNSKEPFAELAQENQQQPDSKTKFQELQLQYLAIKKELKVLKGSSSKERNLRNQSRDSGASNRIIVGVMSPEDNCSCCSGDYSKSGNCQPISQSYQQKDLRLRKKKESSQFRSVDTQLDYDSKNHFTSLKSVKKELEKHQRTHVKKNTGKPSVMQSQLQLGLRKLSLNKQLAEIKIQKDKASKTAIKSRKEKSVSGASYITHKSSNRYHECFSNKERSEYSPQTSDYHLAHDSESLCSCCKEEIQHRAEHSQEYNNFSNSKTSKPHKRKNEHTTSRTSGKAKTENREDSRVHQKRKTINSRMGSNAIDTSRQSEMFYNGPMPFNPQIMPPQWVNTALGLPGMDAAYQCNLRLSNQWNGMAQPLFSNGIHMPVATSQIIPQVYQQMPLYVQPQSAYQPMTVNPCVVASQNIQQFSPSNHSLAQLQQSLASKPQDTNAQIQLFEEFVKFAKANLSNQNNEHAQKLEEYTQILDQLRITQRSTRNEHLTTESSNGKNMGHKTEWNSSHTNTSVFSDENRKDIHSLRVQTQNSIIDSRRHSEQNYERRFQKQLQNLTNKTDLIEQRTPHLVANQKHLGTLDLNNLREQISEVDPCFATFDKSGQKAFDQQVAAPQTSYKKQAEQLKSSVQQPEEQVVKDNAQDEKSSSVIWIDFGEAKKSRKSDLGSNKKHAQARTTQHAKSTYECPQIIPEEREDDNHSPTRPNLNIATPSNGQSTFQTEADQPGTKRGQAKSWAMDFQVTPKQTDQTANLAEAFKQKMQKFELKLVQRTDSFKEKPEKKGFTKEELALKRKEILKSARQSAATLGTFNANGDLKSLTPKAASTSLTVEMNKAGQAVPTQLLQRLAQGQKQDISRKEMLKLTQKNYNALPEIKQKKIDEAKREEARLRLVHAKEQEKKRRESQQQRRKTLNKTSTAK